MKQNTATKDEMKLIGITTRTNNAHLFEADPLVNKISLTVQKYFHNELARQIKHRKTTGVTYCVYTDYESDVNGDYTYFIGEEVTDFNDQEEIFTCLTIPAQSYQKFTNDPAGPMPAVCIDLWKKIWTLSPAEMGGERSYIADFEVYDERSRDHQNVVMDIYIGVKEGA